MAVSSKSKSPTKTISSRKKTLNREKTVGEFTIDKTKTCAFCDKQANDIVSINDLKLLSLKKADIPAHARKLVSLPICNIHFYKYVTHPQIKKNRKEIKRIDNNKTGKKKKK
jgi:hypothetical protein